VRIFGFGKRHDEFATPGEPVPADERHEVGDHAAEARAQLLDDIAGFLTDNTLEVTPDHLYFAHQAFSGENPKLAETITARQIARESITARWLADTAQEVGIVRDRKAELDRAMKRLEDVLEAFLATSKQATHAASDFGTAIAGHARDMEGLGSAVIDAGTLVELTRAMIDRTRQVEGEMVRAEQETRSLRDRLKRAQREAQIDHLTGLPNRRAFDALFEREVREARAEQEELCVALCDIDHFKAVNDLHGHGVGDRVICAIAKHFKGLSNNRCHVARHGGEEFVLLFRGLDCSAAAEKLDAARAAFAGRRLINRENDEALGRVTYSAGVTDVFAHASQSAALKAADLALYAAKAAGRNCVRVG
jgi:diguanylate cyclase